MAPAAEPFLLLPGTLCDARVWQPVLDRLRHPGARVVPLHGAGTAPDMARLLLNSAPPRFALAGFSLGAIVALEVVAQAPGRVSRLALVSGNARADAPDSSARRHALLQAARRDGVRAVVERDLWPSYMSGPLCGPRLRALVGDMAEDAGLAVLGEQTGMAVHRADSRARLPGITVPTLVVAGADDCVCPPGRGAEIAAAVPSSRFVLLPGVGHFVPLEAPGALAGALGAWLKDTTS